jgi:hypothetical protein
MKRYDSWSELHEKTSLLYLYSRLIRSKRIVNIVRSAIALFESLTYIISGEMCDRLSHVYQSIYVDVHIKFKGGDRIVAQERSSY